MGKEEGEGEGEGEERVRQTLILMNEVFLCHSFPKISFSCCLQRDFLRQPEPSIEE